MNDHHSAQSTIDKRVKTIEVWLPGKVTQAIAAVVDKPAHLAIIAAQGKQTYYVQGIKAYEVSLEDTEAIWPQMTL